MPSADFDARLAHLVDLFEASGDGMARYETLIDYSERQLMKLAAAHR